MMVTITNICGVVTALEKREIYMSRNDDTISRQAAIDALRTCYDTETVTMDNGDEYINYGDAIGEIEQLPSAQPEIVRCKECAYASKDDYTHCPYVTWWNSKDDFCSKGKRRTDE